MEQEETEARDIPDDQVTKLEGHTSEVFICSWSPTGPLLASGSALSLVDVCWTVRAHQEAFVVQLGGQHGAHLENSFWSLWEKHGGRATNRPKAL